MVPLAAASKYPVNAGYTERRPAPDELEALFALGRNISIATGNASGGLVDVGLDCPEARAAAVSLLPGTARTHGHPGAPASHYWYRVDLTPGPLSLRERGSGDAGD